MTVAILTTAFIILLACIWVLEMAAELINEGEDNV